MKAKENTRREKIHNILVATFVIVGFTTLVPMILRCLADVVSYPYSTTVANFIDNYWYQFSFVATLIEFALIPFVFKDRNQTFKEGLKSFFFKRPNKYLPSLMTTLFFIFTTTSTYTIMMYFIRLIGTIQLFAILSICSASFFIYDAVQRLLRMNKTKIASKLVPLIAVIALLILPSYLANEASKPIPIHLNTDDLCDRYVTIVYHGVQDGTIILDYEASGITRRNQLFALPENRTLTIDSTMMKILNANPQGLDYEILFSKDFPWLVFFITYFGIVGFFCFIGCSIHFFEKIDCRRHT